MCVYARACVCVCWLVLGFFCLFVCQLDTSVMSSGKREPQLKNACREICGVLSWLTIDMGGSAPLGRWSWEILRKEVKHEPGQHKQASSAVLLQFLTPGLHFGSCRWTDLGGVR